MTRTRVRSLAIGGLVVPALLTATAAARVDGQAGAVQSALLEGVTSLRTAGVPGPLAVFGEHAVPVLAGRSDGDLLPVAVAAQWERGRVVALGHGGMLGSEALEHEGTRRFVVNAVRWLLAGREDDRGAVGVLNNEAMAKLLGDSGFTVVSLPRQWVASLPNLAAVVIDAHALDDETREPLATFVRDGGGLLTAGLGWGWLQLNPGRTIHEHPGNRLLVEAGLAWCDGTLETTAPGVFVVGEPAVALHAVEALEVLEREGGGVESNHPRQHVQQASATLTAAFRVLPAGHPLLLRAQRLRQDPAAIRVPTQARPLGSKDAISRALLALDVELERRLPADQVQAHPAAADFPGVVSDDAPRVRRQMVLDPTVSGWHSTGLYAPPGEPIELIVNDAPPGARVRIGCHTDHLWHHDRWRRVPDISRERPLASGSTRVASAFGGLVYIELPQRRGRQGRPERAEALPVEIVGAVEAPRFVLDRTTQAEWLESRQAPAPWGELESRKVIVSVPSGALRELDDPAALMRFWDAISDAHATLATIDLVPPKPHRFVADIQISAGYMHSGYPIMTHLDAVADMTSLERLRRGSWGLLHELGHNHQEADWTFDGTVEVTCNLFSLHAIDTVCSPPPGDRGHPGVNEPPSLEDHSAAGAPFETWKNDPFLALHMYVQLQEAFGWETFKRVFAEYRALPRSERPRSDAEKRDQWMVRFSRACGRNLAPFFDKWGVPVSDEAKRQIADLEPWGG